MEEQSRVEAILEKIRSASWELRQEGAKELRQIRDESALPILLKAIKEDDDFEVRMATVEALSNFEHQEAEDAIQETLFDEEWEVQWAAMRALGSYWKEPDLKKMGDKLPEKRILGIEGLAKQLSPKFLKPLLAALDDEIEEVQAASVKALAQLGDPSAIKPLKAFARHSPKELRALAEETLSRLGATFEDGSPGVPRKNLLSCEVCQQPLPFSFLKRVGSPVVPRQPGDISNDFQMLCQFHFEEYTEKIKPFQGKLKACKQCKTHWSKVELVEGSCPPCREKRYESLQPAPEGQFRCFYSHKLRSNRDLSPVSTADKPLSTRSAYKIANSTATSPFLTPRAVLFLKESWEKGYFLCEKKREFRPVEELAEGEDFRDNCLSQAGTR
mgnify:CR=1 FL=1